MSRTMPSIALCLLLLGCGPGAISTGGDVPAAGRCAPGAPEELPRSLLVERRMPGCDAGAAICRDELDGAGFAVVARAHADGRVEPVAGDPGTGVQASDPLALEGGGFRFVRTSEESRRELVTVGPRGEQRSVDGGAARPLLLGGRSFADPSDRSGRLRAELSSDDPADVRLIDTTRDDRRLAVLPLRDAVPLQRSPRVAADGARFGLVVRAGDDVVWLVREARGDRLHRRVLDGAAPAAPLAVGPALRWVALPSDLRGVVVSGPDRAFTVPVSPAVAAAFDPCARWLYLVGGAGPQLLRVDLGTAEVETLGPVPSFVERLEPTPDGALLVGSSLPGGVTGEPRAAILSPFDARVLELPLPDDTERAANAF